MLDIVRTIQGILDAAHGHPILIEVNKDRTALSWRVTDMPHHLWRITVHCQTVQEFGLKPADQDMPDDPEAYYNERAEQMP